VFELTSPLALAPAGERDGYLSGNHVAKAFQQVIVCTVALSSAPALADSEPFTHQSWPLTAHIVFSLIAYALFAGAATAALAMTWKERQIRESRVSSFGEKLPSILKLEQLLFLAITVGFVTLSLSVFSGLIFIEDIRSQHLTHKTVLTILSWFVFGGLLAGRWRFGWRGRTAARWTMTGCALLLLAYAGARFVLEVVLGRQWG